MSTETKRCQYCVRGDKPCCGETRGSYTCIRVSGHSGVHVACAPSHHELMKWCDCANESVMGCGVPSQFYTEPVRCSRIAGHDGDHVYCKKNGRDPGNHRLHIWPQESEITRAAMEAEVPPASMEAQPEGAAGTDFEDSKISPRKMVRIEDPGMFLQQRRREVARALAHQILPQLQGLDITIPRPGDLEDDLADFFECRIQVALR